METSLAALHLHIAAPLLFKVEQHFAEQIFKVFESTPDGYAVANETGIAYIESSAIEMRGFSDDVFQGAIRYGAV